MQILHSFHRLAFRVAHNKQWIGGTCTVFVELTYKHVVLSRQHTAEHLKPVALLPLISCCDPAGYQVSSVEGRLTSPVAWSQSVSPLGPCQNTERGWHWDDITLRLRVWGIFSPSPQQWHIHKWRAVIDLHNEKQLKLQIERTKAEVLQIWKWGKISQNQKKYLIQLKKSLRIIHFNQYEIPISNHFGNIWIGLERQIL